MHNGMFQLSNNDRTMNDNDFIILNKSYFTTYFLGTTLGTFFA